MSSGVGVDPICMEMYQDLKLKRKYLYISYAVSADMKTIVMDSSLERDKLSCSTEDEARGLYEAFASQLPVDECRYIAYDFEFVKEPGEGMRNKICFIVWSPDTTSIKRKMLHASSKESIRRVLDGIAVEIQATDMDEVSFDSVKAKAKGI